MYQNIGNDVLYMISTTYPGPKFPVDAVLFGGGGTWRKSSSISSTFARRDFEDLSLSSNSLILFDIIIVFLVIFFPGLDIRRIHGSHCRKTDFICSNATICSFCCCGKYNIMKVFRKNLPIEAFHVCQQYDDDNWVRLLSVRQMKRPWTWCSWSMSLLHTTYTVILW